MYERQKEKTREREGEREERGMGRGRRNRKKEQEGANFLIIHQSKRYILLTNRGIIVQEVVEDFCAYRETADQSSSQDGFFSVCNDTFFDKFYNTITKHFRMHP